MTKFVGALLISALAVSGAELTGKWSGSFDITNSSGERKADTASMTLKEHGGEVTGTAGPSAEEQWPLRKGKLDGEKLTFDVSTNGGGVLSFDLTFDGESIQGTCLGTGGDGKKWSAQVRLKPLN